MMLENIQVNIGDVIMLSVFNGMNIGDYAGANLTITAPNIDVPEPASLAMLSLGSLLMLRRNKH